MAALRDLGEFIREQRRHAQISLRQLAEQAGVSNPYLSQIERGLRKPSAEVLQQIANALRVSTPIMYLRAGLLDTREGQGVLAAIAADEGLTSRQKQTLSEIYEAFRRENVRSTTPDEPAEPIDDTVRSEPVTRTVRKVAKKAVRKAVQKQAVQKQAAQKQAAQKQAARKQAARKQAVRKHRATPHAAAATPAQPKQTAPEK
ncbi:MAG TPA: helix-turn-helix domain-containing protein [Actinocatenispora sp.]